MIQSFEFILTQAIIKDIYNNNFRLRLLVGFPPLLHFTICHSMDPCSLYTTVLVCVHRLSAGAYKLPPVVQLYHRLNLLLRCQFLAFFPFSSGKPMLLVHPYNADHWYRIREMGVLNPFGLNLLIKTYQHFFLVILTIND